MVKLGFVFVMFWSQFLYSVAIPLHNSMIYKNIKNVPKKDVALLLGTTKYVAKGRKNYYYTYRIEAAVKLWRAGKIRAIVVSGDGRSKYHDEATMMHDDLVRLGVPSKYITKDKYGLRTLDSIIRAKEIFDLEDYIIISQTFHLKRALLLADAKGQKAIGFATKEITGTPAAKKMEAREVMATFKAYLDLYVLDTKAKVYGKKVKVIYKNDK